MNDKFLNLFRNPAEGGLNQSDKKELIQSFNQLLTFDPLFTKEDRVLPAEIAALLQKYGPFWVTLDVDSGIGRRLHAVVVTDISKDTPPENTKVKYYDVADKSAIRESNFTDFLAGVKAAKIYDGDLETAIVRLKEPIGEGGKGLSRVTLKLRNRYKKDQGLPNCDIRIVTPAGEDQVLRTNSAGDCTLNLSEDGVYQVYINYAHQYDYSVRKVFELNESICPYAIETPRYLRIEVLAGKFTCGFAYDPFNPSAYNPSEVISSGSRSITYLFTPLFMGSTVNTTKHIIRDVKSDLKYAILHIAGNATSAIRKFLTDGARDSASTHYMIDHDGRVIKLVDEKRIAWHGNNPKGTQKWMNDEDINAYSIGIDLVPVNYSYSTEQYASLNALLSLICSNYSIPRESIIAHGDVDPSSRYDPDACFKWSELEKAGFSFQKNEKTISFDTMYGGLFGKYPETYIRSGDRDSDKRYGAQKRPEIEENVISSIQKDLISLGYNVENTGVCDHLTLLAIKGFQYHILSEGNPHLAALLFQEILNSKGNVAYHTTKYYLSRSSDPPLNTGRNLTTNLATRKITIRFSDVPLNSDELITTDKERIDMITAYYIKRYSKT